MQSNRTQAGLSTTVPIIIIGYLVSFLVILIPLK